MIKLHAINKLKLPTIFSYIYKYFLYVSNGKDRKSKPKLTNTICATVFKVEIGEISTLKTNYTDSTS